MRKKMWLVTALLALAVACSGLALAGCAKDPVPTVKIDSETSAVLRPGELYELEYTVTDATEVSVTASGGTYDAESKTFSAADPGTYTLTVLAKNNSQQAKAEVTITVLNATPLSDAIAAAKALDKADYNSFADVTRALSAAQNAHASADSTQAELDEALSALNEAVSALVPKAVVKAVVSDASVTYGNKTYDAAQYDNFADVLAEFQALNERTDLTLNSAYRKAFDEIAKKLVKRPSLEVFGIESGVTALQNPGPVTYTAAVEQGASVEWFIGDASKGTENTLTFTPELGTKYTVKAVAKKDGVVNEQAYEVTYIAMTPISSNNNIVVESGKITSNEFTSWDANGKRKVNFDFDIAGDFSIAMDVKLNDLRPAPDNCAFALILNTGSVDDSAGEYAVRYRYENMQEISYHGNDIRSGSAAVGDRLTAGKTVTVVLTRKDMGTNAEGAKISKYEWYILENGEKIAYLSKDDDTAFHDTVTLSLNFENIKAEVSNIRVAAQQIVDKSGLNAAVNAYQARIDAQELVSSDYSNWAAFSTQLAASRTMLRTVKADMAKVEAQLKALNDAYAALVCKPVVIVEPTNEGFTFAGKEYAASLYGNYDTQILAIQEVNVRAADSYTGDDKIDKQSVYDAALREIVDALEAKLTLTVSGMESGNYVYSGSIPEVKWTASAEASGENKDVVWSVNGGEFSAAAGEFVLDNPQFGTEYTVTAKAVSDGGVTATETRKVTFMKAKFAVNDEINGTIVDRGEKLTVDKYIEWGTAGDFNKAWLSNVLLTGDFEVSADFTYFTGYGDKHVAALFLAQSWGSGNSFGTGFTGYVAAVYVDGAKGNQIEFNTRDGEKSVIDLPDHAAAFDPMTTLTYSIKRVVNPETRLASYTYSLISKGVVIASYTVADNPNADAVRVSFNCERFLGEISNVVIKTASAVNVVERGELVGLAAKASGLKAEEYDLTDEATKAFFDGQAQYAKQSWTAYNFHATQALVNTAVQELKTALAALKAKKAVVEENAIAFAEKTYARADYANFDEVKAAVALVSGDGAAYIAEVKEELAKLTAMETLDLSALQQDLYLTGCVGKTYRLTDSVNTISKVTADGTELTAEADGAYLFAPAGLCHNLTVTYADDSTLTLNLNATAENTFKLVHGKYEGRVVIGDNGTSIEVVKRTDWDESFTQIVEGDQIYSGNYIEATFDVTYAGPAGNADEGVVVLAAAFVSSDANKDLNARRKGAAFGAVRYRMDGTSELCAGADQWEGSYQNTPDRTKDDPLNEDIKAKLTAGSTNRFRLIRDLTEMKLSLELLDENGQVVGRRVSHQITESGPVRLIFNFEHVLARVENISVFSQNRPTDRTGLWNSIAEADQLFLSAYETALAADVQAKLTAAVEAYRKLNVTQAEADAAEEALDAAVSAAKAGTVDSSKIPAPVRMIKIEYPSMLDVFGNGFVAHSPYDWGQGDDRKVVLPDLLDSDYIEVSFKVRYNEMTWDGAHVFAFMFLNENNMKRETTFVLNYNDRFMRVEANNANHDQKDIAGAADLGRAISVKVVREIVEGKAKYTFTAYGEDGAEIASSVYAADNAFAGRAALGFNLEHVGVTVSQIQLVTERPQA